MLKKLVISAGILGALSFGPRWAFAVAPPVQDQGSVSRSTTTSVSVSTNPTIVYSTATFRLSNGLISSTMTPQYMSDRIALEFFNDTSTDVWIGPSVAVSSMPGVNYGRRLPPGSAWSHDGSIRDWFVMCGSSWTSGQFFTEKKFVVTQEK